MDPRLLVGLVLVAGSTVGVWALVEALDDTTEVLVAPTTVTAGTRVTLDDLRVESVRLGGLADGYLAPADVPGGGLVVTRTVREGELVPAASVAEGDTAGTATVVVPTRGPLARGTAPGAVVDVWAAGELERGVFEPPVVLVAGAEVAAVLDGDGMVAGDGPSVELLIPRAKTAALLEALASGDAIDLVPSPAVASSAG
ncbi:SAF domain-containing protein [Agromyces sp. GXQ0307]|uniref:SAF domain-containing protein n=1 Tax=Agromyces sp. GXQ0307 TaxID=3377835 RepID=UPI00383B31C1